MYKRTNSRNPLMIPVVVFLILIIVSGCGGGRRSKPAPPKRKKAAETAFKNISLKLRAADGGSDYINITLIVKNTGKRPLNLSYASAETHDFYVKDDSGREIWRWSRDKLFAQMFKKEALAAQKSIEYSARWRKVDNENKRVAPGYYVIYGIWRAKGYGRALHTSVKVGK